MDRFSKTTEIDVSNSTNIEDDTPKKKILSNIIAIVLCLLISIIVWLYVMEIDTEQRTKSYSKVSVYSNDTVVETVDLELNVIRKQLVDVSKSDIKIVKISDEEYSILLPNDSKNEFSIKVESIESGKIIATLSANDKS